MTWAALAVVALLVGDRADGEAGRIVFWIFACFLFVAGVLVAPWHEVNA